jgi:hypothetical protein
MSVENIRVDVVTKVEQLKASFAGGYSLVIEYDNRDVVDYTTQRDPYLQVSVDVMEAEQASLTQYSEHRFRGVITLLACVPEGSGKSKANKLLEHFYKGLHRNSFGKVRTFMATPGGDKTHLGWVYVAMLVPFWSDQPA